MIKRSYNVFYGAHRNELIKRAENENILLCPQDTTELDYSSQKQNDAHGFLNAMSLILWIVRCLGEVKN